MNYSLPGPLASYLDTSFLGQRQYITVDSVNFTYFAFGPLQANSTGAMQLPQPYCNYPCMSHLQLLFMCQYVELINNLPIQP